MTYILLALIITGTPRPATWTAEFSTKEKCEVAGKALTKMAYGVSFICAEK
jgi:hypothetical protein